MATVKEFSVEEKLVTLLRLQKIDSKLDEIEILKGELPMEVKDLEDELEGLNTRLTNLEDEIKGIEAFISQKKEAIKDSEANIKKYEKQQDNVKNNREYEAITKEIEMQTLENKLNEKQIREANDKIKEKNVVYEAAKKTIKDKENNLNHKKTELEKIIADTDKEEKRFEKESEKAGEEVEPRLLAAYEKIRKTYRNGLAVVSIERDSCGGCFNMIPPQQQAEIRQRKKIIVCEHCGRVLVDADLFNSVSAKK
ncbi:MAG: zinc ribbon domain-containing protein [Chitinophagaceae bacterium]